MNIEKIIENLGYKITKKIRETDKNIVFVAKKEESKFFIKGTTDYLRFRNLINEYEANKFVRQAKPRNLKYYIPKTKLIQNNEYCLAIFEFIPGKTLAAQENLTIRSKPTKAELETLYQIQKFYYQFRRKDLPAYFIRTANNYSLNNYFKKQDSYLVRPVGRLIDRQEVSILKKNMKKIGYARAFQHHDFVLWNIFRYKGQLVVADTEFSRWGMRWYDIAYFFIQTYVYFKQPEYATACLKFFVERFEQDFPNCKVRNQIMFPMNYRITANLNESLGDKKMEKLVRELLDKILTNDFKKLLY